MAEFRITRRADALIPGPPFTADELRVLTACLLHVAGYKNMNEAFVAALQAKLVKMLDDIEPPCICGGQGNDPTLPRTDIYCPRCDV